MIEIKKQKIEEFMTNNGYMLMSETRQGDDAVAMHFCLKDFTNPLRRNVTVYVDTGEFEIYAVINPGMIKITTGTVYNIFYPEQFSRHEKWLTRVIGALYNEGIR